MLSTYTRSFCHWNIGGVPGRKLVSSIVSRYLELETLADTGQGTLACIHAQASTTRRSAGIPALMTGILSSQSPSSVFEDVIMDLKILARQPVLPSEKDETNLPQVHATNCLKEIFKGSTLG